MTQKTEEKEIARRQHENKRTQRAPKGLDYAHVQERERTLAGLWRHRGSTTISQEGKCKI
jgi:hypothetical protein